MNDKSPIEERRELLEKQQKVFLKEFKTLSEKHGQEFQIDLSQAQFRGNVLVGIRIIPVPITPPKEPKQPKENANRPVGKK